MKSHFYSLTKLQKSSFMPRYLGIMPILIIKKGGFERFNTYQTRPTSQTSEELYLLETNLEPDSLADLEHISLGESYLL